MNRFEPIAIIGTGCVLPGAHSRKELTDLVLAQKVLIEAADHDALGMPPDTLVAKNPKDAMDKMFTNRGGFVRNFAGRFQADRYALPASLLLEMDLQYQWTLKAALDALDEANIALGDPLLARAGMILGNLVYPNRTYSQAAQTAILRELGVNVPKQDTHEFNRYSAGMPALLGAKALGLGGTSFCLDAACASSLYAIKYACERLQSRDADLMIAGAVNCSDPSMPMVGFTGMQAMSPTGSSRPFSTLSDGIVPSQGVGAFVLQRLDDAVKLGRPILGVIRGIGISNDGNHGGFFVPSVSDQVICMQRAYQQAAIDPRSVSYIECHATGTQVGDKAEIQGMKDVFAANHELYLGALKANLGHLITASGSAALLKVLGMMEVNQIPATPNAHPLIPLFDSSILKVPTSNEEWKEGKGRIAAVSSFGFGGNNAHLILEQWRNQTIQVPVQKDAPSDDSISVVAVAVRTDRHSNAQEFAADLFHGKSPAPHRAEVSFATSEMATPPKDLQCISGRQLLFLRTALDACQETNSMDRTRTAVLAGAGIDDQTIRGRTRWLLSHLLTQNGIHKEDAELASMKANLAKVCDAAGFLGSLANITANRLNHQLQLTAYGCSISAEEISGNIAIELACRSLLEKEIDCAIVGAVSVRKDQLGAQPQDFDAASVLVLKRTADALAANEHIYCTISLPQKESSAQSMVATPTAHAIQQKFGNAQEASGALMCASLALAADGAQADFPEQGICLQQSAMTDAKHKLEFHKYTGKNADRKALPTVDANARIMSFGLHLPTLQKMKTSEAPMALRKLPAAPHADAVIPMRIYSQDPVHSVSASPAYDSMVDVHCEFLDQYKKAHFAYMDLLRNLQHQVAGQVLPVIETVPVNIPAPVAVPIVTPERKPIDRFAPEVWRSPNGLCINRDQLEWIARDKVSTVLGKEFEVQDHIPIQVRMPMSTLLLADSVLGIEGKAMSMTKGTIWTESVVREDSWYMHQGYMPAGVFMESGQADLLLVSWLGINAHMSDERVYRLLGCDVKFLGPLPRPGDVIQFQIIGDGFAQQGDVRLFFFHFDCRINGELRVVFRNGQAGFFTYEELRNSAGLIWSAQTAPYKDSPRLSPPRRALSKSSISNAEFNSYLQGDLVQALGVEYEPQCDAALVPTYKAGQYNFIEEIVQIDFKGGPAGRGYAHSHTTIHPDDWYFASHFLNDPCMPGSLMIEAGIQLIAFYMTAAGYTLDKAGWCFEPVPEEVQSFRCRAQVIPTTKTLEFKIFIDEIIEGPEPTVFAHLLGIIDGKQAFGCERMGIRLVPPPKPVMQELPLSWQDVSERWHRNFQLEPMVYTDIATSLYRRFIRKIWTEEADFLTKYYQKPVLYLANHQTGIESMLFMFACGAINTLPVRVIAKKEHRTTLLGQLFQMGKERSPNHPPMDTFFADREDQMQMLALFQEIKESLQRQPFSLFVHSEGTRAESVRKTSKVSGVLIELALACNIPIVPVRFFGGLPQQGEHKLEFPYQYGQQDIYLGRGIEAEQLKKMPYGERSAFVLDAMNAIGPAFALEQPLARPTGDHTGEVIHGSSEVASVILETLKKHPIHCEETKAMFRGEMDPKNPLSSLILAGR